MSLNAPAWACGKLYKIFDVHGCPQELTTMKEDHELSTKSIPSTSSLYTEKQGQYLAFIYHYTKINRLPPAEADMQAFFGVSPPSVHGMLVGLEKKNSFQGHPGKPGAFVFFDLYVNCPSCFDTTKFNRSFPL